MSRRRPGLQRKWAYVVNSLQQIVPSYELASSRISLFQDHRMRVEAVNFASRQGFVVLDLGAGPGTMSRLVASRGAVPVLLDASRVMLSSSGFENLVQGTFEYLPFRDGAFDGVVSGFALRDAYDLEEALEQISRVLKLDGRLAFCDLGKPDSSIGTVFVGFYVRVAPMLIGLMSAGRAGLKYGSLFATYNLVLHNRDLGTLLTKRVGPTIIHETQFGGSIVVTSVKGKEAGN